MSAIPLQNSSAFCLVKFTLNMFRDYNLDSVQDAKTDVVSSTSYAPYISPTTILQCVDVLVSVYNTKMWLQETLHKSFCWQ